MLRQIDYLVIGCCVFGAAASSVSAQEYRPIQIGSWAFSPTLEVNSVLNDNLYGSSFRKVTGFGFELYPAFTLSRDNGFSSTSLSASATVSRFVDHSDADKHSETVGLHQVFRISKEQTFTLNGSYNQSDGGAQAPGSGLVSTSSFGSLKAAQVQVATERTFGRLTTSFSTSAVFSDVQNSGGAPVVIGSTPATGTGSSSTPSTLGVFAALPSGKSSTYSANASATYAGAFLSPYVASGVSSQSQSRSLSRSLTVRSGVMTGRWRLFKADLYGGYLFSETELDTLIGTQRNHGGGPSFGASITWDPLRYLVLRAAVDAQFGVIALPSASNILAPSAAQPTAPGATEPTTPASPATTAVATDVLAVGQNGSTLSFTANAQYNFARRWTASANVGYVILNSTGQKTKVETAGLTATYLWSRANDLILSYNFIRSNSDLAPLLGATSVTGPVFVAGPLVNNVLRAGVRHRF